MSTRSLRIKETEEDYGYIFDPDLVMVELSEKQIEEIKASLPELHEQRAKRFVLEYGLDSYTAEVLASSFSISNLFEEEVKNLANKEKKFYIVSGIFMTRELPAILNRDNLSLDDLNLDPKEIAKLIDLLGSGKITEKNAKEAMIAYIHKKIKPVDFIRQENLIKDIGAGETEQIVERVLKENSGAVNDYKKGGARALNFLVGIVMRQTKGKTDPETVQKMIEEKLK